MDLLRHWQLRERPFEATWDPRFFFPGRDHEEALSRLHYLAQEQTMNIGLLTGEIGCGKTLTRAVFTRQLDPGRFRAVVVENAGFAFGDLLGVMLRQLEAGNDGAGASRFARCERLLAAARRLRAEGRHLLLVLDEAQDLSAAALRELRWLTNFNGGGENLLTLILVGQPELRAAVATLPAINQRISLRFHLGRLRPEEAPGYFRHRLGAAGHPHGDTFAPEAVDAVFRATRGVPREMNRVAKLALEHAWLKEAPRVDAPAVDAVIRDLERHQALPVA